MGATDVRIDINAVNSPLQVPYKNVIIIYPGEESVLPCLSTVQKMHQLLSANRSKCHFWQHNLQKTNTSHFWDWLEGQEFSWENNRTFRSKATQQGVWHESITRSSDIFTDICRTLLVEGTVDEAGKLERPDSGTNLRLASACINPKLHPTLSLLSFDAKILEHCKPVPPTIVKVHGDSESSRKYWRR